MITPIASFEESFQNTEKNNLKTIIYLELSPPAQEHIAKELYRGSYRSRSPERGVLGGSWRYIAGGLCRGGEVEEEEEGEGGGREKT